MINTNYNINNCRDNFFREDKCVPVGYAHISRHSFEVNMIVYKITNRNNGKIYIGRTTLNLKKRKQRIAIESKRSDYGLIYNAISQDGMQNFDWEVLKYCKTRKDLNRCQGLYIKHYKTTDIKFGYNCTTGGVTPHLVERTRKKIGDTRNRRNIGKGKNHPTYGTHQSKETKAKCRLKMKGRTIPTSVKEKISENSARPMLGKHHSQEVRDKISKSNMGKKQTTETKKKISKAVSGKKNPMYGVHIIGKDHHNWGKFGKDNPTYGQKRSKAVKKKMSKAHKGKVFSKETRKRMSVANKKWRAEKRKQGEM